MKKNYLIFGLLASLGAMAQAPFATVKVKGQEVVNRQVKTHNNNLASKTTAGTHHAFRLVQAEQMINALGYQSSTDYNVYANPQFMDSTASSSSSSGNSNVFNMRSGANFDPVSIYWGGSSLTPIMTSSDAYTIDTVYIGMGYQKVNYSINDTLYVECQWGPSSSSNYQGLSISSQTPALTFSTPKVNASASHGNVSHITATSNKLLIKRVLLTADTAQVSTDGYVAVAVNQAIPAGNIFSVTYAYVPGQPTTSSDIMWAYNNATSAQTINGMVAYLYSDPSTTSNYKFYDSSSKSIGLDYIAKQRYGLFSGSQAFLNSCMLPNTEGNWDIGFSVTYNSSVGVEELNANGYSLSQNIPNPYTGESMVRYNLVKDAKMVKFTVRDIMGRIMSQTEEDSTVGTHTVKLGSYAAGVYYYSLEVDGKTTTKKMIVE